MNGEPPTLQDAPHAVEKALNPVLVCAAHKEVVHILCMHHPVAVDRACPRLVLDTVGLLQPGLESGRLHEVLTEVQGPIPSHRQRSIFRSHVITATRARGPKVFVEKLALDGR